MYDCCNDFKKHIVWKKLSSIDKSMMKSEGITEPLDGYYFLDLIGTPIGKRINFCPYCGGKIEYPLNA